MVKIGHYYEDNISNFKIYAPHKESVIVEIDNGKTSVPLTYDENTGYWIGSCKHLPENTLYWIKIDNERSFPDPSSRYQPFGVHGASMIVSPRKVENKDWKGVKIEDAIIYELHVGTFTKEGNLKSATQKLSHLASLGINVIELMPICEFPGNFDWGYDNVYLFALESSYGTYSDLKNFIEEAHRFGISVILDVVYNHFGPEGNYSGFFAPYTKDADTPWGSAINFDSADNNGVREFYLANVEWWLKDIGFDGFRLDAWAMIDDCSESKIQREITNLAHLIGEQENRNILIIAEHLRNNKLITSKEDNGDNCDSQWVDDFGLSIRSFLTPDKNDKLLKSFYQFEDIIKAFKQTYVLDGTRFNYAVEGYTGSDSLGLKPQESIVYIQNHDMIGNRVLGDRFISTAGIDKALLATTSLFSNKNIPMIFMGEEFGESNPFTFFESFSDPWLIDAVREGRQKEWQFSKLKPKDSHDIETFKACRLNWELINNKNNQLILEKYKKLIELKKNKIIGCEGIDGYYSVENNDQIITIDNGISIVVLNFSNTTKEIQIDNNYLIAFTTQSTNNHSTVNSYSAIIFIKQ